MGWSIDTVRGELDSIFDANGKKYRITHANSETPVVVIQYEGEISIAMKKLIVDLFPEVVYVNFIPDSTFPENKELAETH